MSRTNSFKLLGQAFKSAREPMWASVQVLIVLTVILATIFFFAEYRVQPEEYNYGKSLLWAFTRYIGDPGKFAGPGPITLVGRLVACLIGIVGILIFAVPAGLVGSGFRSAIDKELRKKHLKEIGEKLNMAFSRNQDHRTKYRYVPRYISLGTLQAQKNMTERDVIDAIIYNPPYRLRNLATAEIKGNHAQDQLVVEMFPFNRIPYGSMIDRGSKVTIACPTSVSESSVGNFGFHLALIGGFNYISKEIEQDVHEPQSYYLIADEENPSNRKAYMEDLRALSKGEDHWTIFIICSDRQSDYALHFVTAANSKTNRESTIINRHEFDRLYKTMSEKLEQEFNIKSERDTEYLPSGSNNVSVRIGGGISTNAFTLRISTELIVWDPRYIAICKDMAAIINNILNDEKASVSDDILKKKGTGYLIS